MSRPRVGSLFAGYGGLDLAVEEVFGAELAWYSEIDKGALKILEHRFPGIANVGSVTEADWSQVEPVDILTGGSPCQDLSTAGGRAGMTEGTRSNLWVAMREAIAQLRPRYVIWENVRGAYSACADSDLGRCPRCVDSSHPGGHAPVLRALGRVLGDLSDLGYDAQWHGLRAADVGAAHGRFRVFVVAQDTHQPAGDQRWLAAPGQAPGGRAWPDAGGPDREGTLLPTPVVGDAERSSLRYDRGNPTLVGALLPTPAVNDMGEGKTVERWDEWTGDMKAKHANGNGHGKSLAIEAQRLLPTPKASLLNGQAKEMHSARWGDYADAIARWESVIGRPAPEPTQTSSKGNPQLSAAFVEWLMGLPAGWVTDVPGITRNEALKALGNGVVPAQAAEALRIMLAREMAA
jgi:DNA (cytosine-5)-methyltransferase 1